MIEKIFCDANILLDLIDIDRGNLEKNQEIDLYRFTSGCHPLYQLRYFKQYLLCCEKKDAKRDFDSGNAAFTGYF